MRSSVGLAPYRSLSVMPYLRVHVRVRASAPLLASYTPALVPLPARLRPVSFWECWRQPCCRPSTLTYTVTQRPIPTYPRPHAPSGYVQEGAVLGRPRYLTTVEMDRSDGERPLASRLQTHAPTQYVVGECALPRLIALFEHRCAHPCLLQALHAPEPNQHVATRA